MKTIALFLVPVGCATAALAVDPPIATATSAKGSLPRLKFQSLDADPTQDQKEWTFGIKDLERSSPTQFLKIGDTVPHTGLKLLKYEVKSAVDPKLGEVELRELTLIDPATKETTVLTVKRRRSP